MKQVNLIKTFNDCFNHKPLLLFLITMSFIINVLLFFALLFTSCCSDKQAIRRLIDPTNPSTEYILKDTTIYKDVVKFDTVVQFNHDKLYIYKYDTIFKETEKVKLQVVYNRDSIYLRAECKADTVKIPLHIIKFQKEKENTWHILGIGIFTLLMAALVGWVAVKSMSK